MRTALVFRYSTALVIRYSTNIASLQVSKECSRIGGLHIGLCPAF